MTRPEARRMNFEEFAADLHRIFEGLVGANRQVLVEKAGRLFRVELEEETDAQGLWTTYDPNRVRQALAQSAGALAGIDRKELIKDLHAARAQRSRGRPA